MPCSTLGNKIIQLNTDYCIIYFKDNTSTFLICIGTTRENTKLRLWVFMGAGELTNPLTQTEPTHKLLEPIHLRVYPIQPITTHSILVRVSDLSFATH